ncbi:MAG: phosphodiester glycosidase family protein [Methylococcales bacterium]
MAVFEYRSGGGGVHIVAGAGGVEMVMLVRSQKEYFMDFIAREAKAQKLKLVINGSFVSLGKLMKLWTYGANTQPLDPSNSAPIGQVIQGGNLIAGDSSTGKFYMSQNNCGAEQFSAGLGNPNSNACAAMGGVAPILINGFPYGSKNLYKKGVPAGAQITGDVSKEYAPFLVQKSNAMFDAMQSGGSVKGKTAVGYSSSKKSTIIIVQENQSPGLDANDFRDVFASLSVDNAVFLDGSDSATLYYDGKFLVQPGENKNEYLTVAVGFR